ncbi:MULTISPECIES: hypothetical protein [Burkholderia]|uniref:hypothetical protein n=1 Tax=Burkholderia TaxID=32008 RepID=UPI00075FE523|nr:MULTISPECIES: hypothetical protein [Burkholderia]
MLIDFYRDPVDLDAVCRDLSNDGVVVIQTSRPNFRKIEDAVTAQMPDCTILALSTEGEDRQWHHYLINDDIEPFDSSTTGARVGQAVARWQAAGSPFPYSVQV